MDRSDIQITTSDNRTLAKRGYKLLKKLGEGSFAKVYLGEFKINANDQTSMLLACKIIDTPKSGELFKTKFLPRELNILASIKHPHIIYVHSIFRRDEKYFIFMR